MSNYTVQSVELSGFRAYLNPMIFDFSKKHSLAIFAPNGNGKSSLVDGFEFMLSDTGSLLRLGLKSVNNNAGPVALAHNLAETAGVPSVVRIKVKSDAGLLDGARKTTGQRLKPAPLDGFFKAFAVSPLIRGYELRNFVESTSSEDRYRDVVKWFDLEPLLTVQKNCKELRKSLKDLQGDESSERDFRQLLLQATDQAIGSWDDHNLLQYINRLLEQKDKTLIVSTWASLDSVVSEIRKRKEEDEQVSAVGLWRTIGTRTRAVSDSLLLLNDFSEQLRAAQAEEELERQSASNSVFSAVWRAAKDLFLLDDQGLSDCPVCLTPLADTKLGSRATVVESVNLRLLELDRYRVAEKKLSTCSSQEKTCRTGLVSDLTTLASLVAETDIAGRSFVLDLISELQSAEMLTREGFEAWGARIAGSLATIDSRIETLATTDGLLSYAKILTVLEQVRICRSKRGQLDRTKDALSKLADQFGLQSAFIGNEIRKQIQLILNYLADPINEIYTAIQGIGAAKIRLELPNEGDQVQHKLTLVIDFAENRSGVQPGGYLSDSQIHSLALAIRLAVAKMFNTDSKIIVLDDIVTSYDADHRRNISTLLASHFADHQVIITTHDERFFSYLREQLDSQHWSFKRIIRLEKTSGPVFDDAKITDDMIDELWANGQLASNQIRQAEEEWLLRICRDFGVDVRIRTLDRPYAFERSELAVALATFLKKNNLKPSGLGAGLANKFLVSLAQGNVENFGSHFQDNPYASSSIGDEKARWLEFKKFQDSFVCDPCARRRFKRPLALSLPVCEKCESKFAFS